MNIIALTALETLNEEAILAKSKLGGVILMDQAGYRYCKIRSSATKVFWRCVYYRKDTGTCPAKAQTEGFMITRKSYTHLHKPNEPVVKKPHGNLKSKARKSAKSKEEVECEPEISSVLN